MDICQSYAEVTMTGMIMTDAMEGVKATQLIRE